MSEPKTLRAALVPRLVVKLADGKEVHHPIVGQEVTIGRDAANRIVIADQFLSKFHAKLLSSENGLTLVDLGSANKTYVNGQPITQSALSYGDQIRFADVHCELRGPEGPVQEKKHQKKKPAPAPAPAPSVPSPPRPAVSPSAAAPVSRPARPAAAARPPGPARGRSAAPAIEADPMKRLLRIGGLLIGVSFALALLLRVLLVPSATPESERAGQVQAWLRSKGYR